MLQGEESFPVKQRRLVLNEITDAEEKGCFNFLLRKVSGKMHMMKL
ncbi:hypothetical protein QKW52_12220 [Bacillus sonorensis]|nr:hypothetical protein [Bacillus sonorensis]